MMHDISYNCYALLVAVFCKCSPEVAFAKLESSRPSEVRHILTIDDDMDMANLRKSGMTYKEIGRIYDLSESAVYRRIARLPQKGVHFASAVV